jgi:hypothetical protein
MLWTSCSSSGENTIFAIAVSLHDSWSGGKADRRERGFSGATLAVPPIMLWVGYGGKAVKWSLRNLRCLLGVISGAVTLRLDMHFPRSAQRLCGFKHVMSSIEA